MNIVLDASAAVELALSRPKAKSILTALEQANWVSVPALFVSECTNVLWKYVQFDEMSKENAHHHLEFCLSIPDEIVATRSLASEILSVACLIGTSAYDLFYLVLARRTQSTLLTLDQKLVKLSGRI